MAPTVLVVIVMVVVTILVVVMVVRTRVVVAHRPVVDVWMRMDAATVTVGMGVGDRHDTRVPPRASRRPSRTGGPRRGSRAQRSNEC